jgi:putative two-component system response regulator
MTGHHFARAVVRMHPQIPVVILAAWNDPESRRQCLESGASDVLTKPLDLSKLPGVVEDNLRRRKLDQKRLSTERAEVFFTAIKAIAGAIDAKSSYAGPHTDRVVELSLKIAAELRLPEEEICALELAAYTRDIGKIDTPDAVLTKPGALSEVEWVDVLKHPSAGASYFDGMPELSYVASIIRHHHERVDGSGYPDGIKGEAIPLGSRILCSADAFEAMTSDRPYKAAVPWDAAIDELRANVGTQFDAAVVEAAARVLEQSYGRQAEERAA